MRKSWYDTFDPQVIYLMKNAPTKNKNKTKKEDIFLPECKLNWLKIQEARL